jgi:cytochrome c peroxidase
MNARVHTVVGCLVIWALAFVVSEWVAKPRAQGGKASTSRTLRLPDIPYRYADPALPAHFKGAVAERFDNTPADNPVTDPGATLGRVLFYDTRLSANNTISCGSCHVQKNAFVDPERFSRAFEGGRTDRHAMSLVNLRYHPRARFFWDERGGNLEDMVLLPVENRIEMGQDVAKLPSILVRDARYPELFRAAFGDPEITNPRIARALAQFLRSMVSYQSRYDEGRASVSSGADDFPNFTAQENRGKALFRRNCSLCHLENQDAHFVMVQAVNNGLDEDTRNADGGVGDITLNPRDVGHFKSPSLRNVEVAGPYMHDGRFETLEAVIDHYSSGGKKHPNRDVRIQPLNFTASEKAALIAFLQTLTDRTFLEDPKFSDPFD